MSEPKKPVKQPISLRYSSGSKKKTYEIDPRRRTIAYNDPSRRNGKLIVQPTFDQINITEDEPEE